MKRTEFVQQKNKEWFDKEARFYDNKNIHVVDTSIKRVYKNILIKYLNLTKPKKILDLGCGTGYIYGLIKQELKRTTFIGIDVSFNMLMEFKKREDAILIQGHVEDMPFKANTFDWIIICAALHHFAGYKTIIENLKKYLRQNGVLIIINEPNKIFYQRSIIRQSLKIFFNKIITLTLKRKLMIDYDKTNFEFEKNFNGSKKEMERLCEQMEVHKDGLCLNYLSSLKNFNLLEKGVFAYLGVHFWVYYHDSKLYNLLETIQKILFKDSGELFYIVTQKS